jgi:hypothetical protein
MSKIIYSFFLIIFINVSILPQLSPKTFHMGDELKLKKTLNEENPASNSISDIITIGDTVWIGTSRGVSLSTDRGLTWKNFYGSEAFGTESVSAIGYSNGVFWAATAHSVERDGQSLPEGSGLRFTSNGGDTWQAVPQPLDQPGDSTIIYGINDGLQLPFVRAIPVTVAIQNLSYDIAFTANTIWVAAFAGGLRRINIEDLINNPETKWERVLLPSDGINEISPNDTIRFPLLPVSGSFGTGSLNHRVFSVISAGDSTLYVGTAGGINKSTDNGISWRKFNHLNQENSISGNFVVALGFNPNNNQVWGATWRAEGQSEFYGVSSSTDGGESWDNFLEGERAHNFGFRLNQVIAPTDNGAFRSTNNGVSWLLPNSIVDDVSGIPLNSNVFYSAASQGNDIWLGSTNGLVKLSETVGSVWQGTWKVYSASQKLTSKTETYAYPNPFTPRHQTLKIKYSTGGKNARVSVRIFDFAMNHVSTVVQNVDRGAPIHVVDNSSTEFNGVIDYWDGRDDAGNIVPNGVYFYRVEVDSDEPVFGKIIVLQ